jgi:acyl transferase domain-containing protein
VTGQQQDGTAADSDIALIGMACRFPRAESLEKFWQLLVDGVEAIDTLATDELARAGIEPALIANSHYVRKGAEIDRHRGF